MLKVALTLFVAAFGLGIFAQEKPKAIRVDEFQDRGGRLEGLIDKTHAFVDSLKRADTESKGVIIVDPGSRYKGECTDRKIREDLAADELIRKVLAVHPELRAGKVQIVRGTINLFHSVVFWVVPKGAEDPKPDDLQVDFGCCCPTIDIIGRERVESETKTLKYTVTAPKLSPSAKLAWSVSAGRIVSGQGTNTITVSLNRTSVPEVLVTLEVGLGGGVPFCLCPNKSEFRTTFALQR